MYLTELASKEKKCKTLANPQSYKRYFDNKIRGFFNVKKKTEKKSLIEVKQEISGSIFFVLLF